MTEGFRHNVVSVYEWSHMKDRRRNSLRRSSDAPIKSLPEIGPIYVLIWGFPPILRKIAEKISAILGLGLERPPFAPHVPKIEVKIPPIFCEHPFLRK
ncbi:hypothetical protein DJ90_3892 [Paenibacillus macerans]|uniref:Uncharacterized protein n=1 Tax=Paenibacillus macerans TaxID=44252 RepID=A0A090ZUL4_PAEMA|nr:hypothetical protein DJ90_3892 [Paenibacillus macerans]